jgi:biotin operon repressor
MLSETDIQTHADRIRNDGYTVIERAVDRTSTIC